jgi:hypothetical protein
MFFLLRKTQDLRVKFNALNSETETAVVVMAAIDFSFVDAGKFLGTFCDKKPNDALQ